MRLVTEAHMEDLAVGAAVLGTSGGDPYIGMLLAKQAIRDHGPVQVRGEARIEGTAADSSAELVLRFQNEGFRVTVIAAPCDPRWRTPAGLELVGPRYFGYDIDYVPIEERARARAVVV